MILFLIIQFCNVAEKMNKRQRSSSESSSESVKLDDLEKKGLLYNALPTPSVLLSSKLSLLLLDLAIHRVANQNHMVQLSTAT